jgi:hypothetical protein
MKIETRLNDGRILKSKKVETDTFSISGGQSKEAMWFHSIDNYNADPRVLCNRGLLSESKRDELLSLN